MLRRKKLVLALQIGLILCLPNFFSRDEVDKWPGILPHHQVSLGLDLQGGGYFLLEVGVQQVLDQQLDEISESLRGEFRKEQIRVTDVQTKGGVIVVSLRDAKDASAAADIMRKFDGRLSVSTRADGTRSFMRFNVFKNDDLPQPEGPISAVISRVRTSIVTSFTACTVP